MEETSSTDAQAPLPFQDDAAGAAPIDPAEPLGLTDLGTAVAAYAKRLVAEADSMMTGSRLN